MMNKNDETTTIQVFLIIIVLIFALAFSKLKSGYTELRNEVDILQNKIEMLEDELVVQSKEWSEE